MKKSFGLSWLTMVLMGVCLLLPLTAGAALFGNHPDNKGPLKISGVTFSSAGHGLILTAQKGVAFSPAYQMVKLSDPDRIIIDIPNAYLATSTRLIQLGQPDIARIELSQSIGDLYQVTRVTIVGTSAHSLDNIQLVAQKNALMVHWDNPTPQDPAFPASSAPKQQHRPFSFLESGESFTPPVPEVLNQAPQRSFSSSEESAPTFTPQPAAQMTVLQSIFFNQGALTLTASPGKPLMVKNQFRLSDPTRVVIDLANTVLANKSMAAAVPVPEGPINHIRVGQFDENTVRIVIETPDPRTVSVVYPGADKSQLILTASLNTLPTPHGLTLESQTVGVIQDVNLSHNGSIDLIHLTTTEPITRQISRQGNVIQIVIHHVKTRPLIIAYDHLLFPEIKDIRLTPTEQTGNEDSQLTIMLENPSLIMDTQLSLDNRMLNILLTNPQAAVDSANVPITTLNLPQSSNEWNGAPVRSRTGKFVVVIDAGHGGKDYGAMRAGVNEKDLNLQVALRLKRALEAKGMTVYMRRTNDVYNELAEITDFTNHIHPDAFVSVHTNASVNTGTDGIETYYFTPQSRELARDVHRHAVAVIRAPDRGIRTARFYVIHHTAVPAILFEMGYISNNAERAALQSDARQQATAEALSQGVVEFLTHRYSTPLP